MDLSGTLFCTLCQHPIDLAQKKTELLCNHTFHTQCFLIYVTRSPLQCNICRHHLITEEVEDIARVQHRQREQERKQEIYAELMAIPGFTDDLKKVKKQVARVRKAKSGFLKLGRVSKTEFMTETFNYCVEYDVFTSARYILGVRPDIEISDKLFARCCDFGQIEMAKWLLSVKPTIDVSEVAFSRACSSGHLELAQWLVSVNPRIDISANTDQAFREACLFGRLDVVKWLISMKEMDEKVNRRGFDAAYVMEQAEIMKLYYDNRERMVGGGKIIERYGNLVEMYAK